MISLNVTIFIQMINFIVALVLLNYLLVAPIRRIILKRKELVITQQNETDTLNQGAASLLSNYEASLQEARAQGKAVREEEKRRAAEQEQAMLDEALKKADAYLAETRAEFARQAETAMAALKGEVSAMAQQAVAKVLQ